jgi:hypothetical protein
MEKTTRTVVSTSARKNWTNPEKTTEKLCSVMVVYRTTANGKLTSLTRFERAENQESKKAA